jgi:hypothetical protein
LHGRIAGRRGPAVGHSEGVGVGSGDGDGIGSGKRRGHGGGNKNFVSGRVAVGGAGGCRGRRRAGQGGQIPPSVRIHFLLRDAEQADFAQPCSHRGDCPRSLDVERSLADLVGVNGFIDRSAVARPLDSPLATHMARLENRRAGGQRGAARGRGRTDGGGREVLVEQRRVFPRDRGQCPVGVAHAGQFARRVVGVRDIHDVVDLDVLQFAQFALLVGTGHFQGRAAG